MCGISLIRFAIDDKISYADTTAGFWLGYDSGAYKLNIGDASHYLKWTGTTLDIKGKINSILKRFEN